MHSAQKYAFFFFFFFLKYLACTRMNSWRVGCGFGCLFLFFFGLYLQGVPEISSSLKDICTEEGKQGFHGNLRTGLAFKIQEVILILREGNKADVQLLLCMPSSCLATNRGFYFHIVLACIVTFSAAGAKAEGGVSSEIASSSSWKGTESPKQPIGGSRWRRPSFTDKPGAQLRAGHRCCFGAALGSLAPGAGFRVASGGQRCGRHVKQRMLVCSG